MYISRIDLNKQIPTNTFQAESNADFLTLMNSKLNQSETNLDVIFETASRAYNVPVNLLKAVAKAESNFRADATSSCGAMGIMQLMPGTAQSLGVTNPYDPEQNIMGGAKYLSGLLTQFDGDASLALAAYNAGPGNVRKYNGIPPFEETQNYVKKVLGYAGADLSAGSIQQSSPLVSALSPELLASGTGDLDLERLVAELRMQLYQMPMMLLEPEDETEVTAFYPSSTIF